jgi:hypothetical protein
MIEIIKGVLPFVTVGLMLYFISKLMGHDDQIFGAIIKEAREAATLRPTLEAFNFFGFFAIAAIMVLCFVFHSIHSILQMSLAGANEGASVTYELYAIAFCVLVLGAVLIFSLRLCERTRRLRDT